MCRALILIAFFVMLVAPPTSLAQVRPGTTVSDAQILSHLNTQVFMITRTINGTPISQLAAVYSHSRPFESGDLKLPGGTTMVTSATGMFEPSEITTVYQGKTYFARLDFVDEELDIAGVTFAGLLLPDAPADGAQKPMPIPGLNMPVSVITAKNNNDFKVLRTTVKSIAARGFPMGLTTVVKIQPTAALFDHDGNLLGFASQPKAMFIDVNEIRRVDAAYTEFFIMHIAIGDQHMVSGGNAYSRNFMRWTKKAMVDNISVFEYVISLGTPFFILKDAEDRPVTKIAKIIIDAFNRGDLKLVRAQAAPPAPAAPSPPKIIYLECSLTMLSGDSPPIPIDARVNLTDSTVNNYPATIGDDLFRWTNNTQVTFELNRYSGNLTAFNSGSGGRAALASGRCLVRRERQF